MKNMWYMLEISDKLRFQWLHVGTLEDHADSSVKMHYASMPFKLASKFYNRPTALALADLVSQLTGHDVFVYQVWGEVGAPEDKMDEIRLVHSSPQYAIPF